MKFEKLTRPSVEALDAILGEPTKCLDHGFIRLVDYMGGEAAITQAARVSYGKGTKTVNEDRGLIRYLMRHRHTTPFEMCEIKLHVKLPVFVARQWVRHRTASINEYSARYSILDNEFYIPDIEDMQAQSTTNNQGREGALDRDQAQHFQKYLIQDAASAYQHYEEMVGAGAYEGDGNQNLARELARMNLPTNIYTQWYWKTNLHNLLHFLALRADPHAQKEIRVYADAICNLVETWVPNVWEAFVDYRLEAHTFSRQEMDEIRAVIQQVSEGVMKPEGASARELAEFYRKLGIHSGEEPGAYGMTI